MSLLALLLPFALAQSDPQLIDTGDAPVPLIWQGDTVHDDGLKGVVGIRAATQSGRGTSDAFCSGTLIDPSWVLTAGHCVPVAQHAADKGFRIEVVVGTQEPYAGRAVVDHMAMHPDYDPNQTPGSGNDLALLHLEAPLTAAEPLPISGVHVDAQQAGLPVTVVGYGRTASDTADTGTKRRADLVYVRSQDPDLLVLTSGRVKWSALLGGWDTVGNDGTSNACNGDSGGASVVQLPDGTFVLLATTVVVYGDCEGGSTGSTALDGHLDWIRASVPGVQVVAHPQPGEVDLVALAEGEPLSAQVARTSNASAGGCDTAGGGASALLALAAASVARRRRSRAC